MKRIMVMLLFVLFVSSCSAKTDDVILYTSDDNSFSNATASEISTETTNILKDNFMISFWLKLDALTTDETLLSLKGNNNLDIIYTTNENNELVLAVKENNEVIGYSSKVTYTNYYDLYSIKCDNNVLKLYFNSVEVFNQKITNGFDSFDLIKHGLVSDLIISDNTIDIDNEYNKKQNALIYDDLFDTNIITTNIELPKIKNNTSLSWVSSNENILTSEGIVNLSDNDETVTLTLTTNEISKDFEFTVLSKENASINASIKSLDTYIPKVMHSNTKLPETINDYSITYSAEGNASIEDNTLIKTTDNPKEDITLIATINETTIKTYNIVLLDETSAYLMTYFNGDADAEEEKLRMAYSMDGLNWIALNNDEPIYMAKNGTNRIRDPYITRDINGDFIICATEGFDNPNIYILKSQDLVTFEESLLKVAYENNDILMSGNRAWAPEMYYDINSSEYRIIFSDPTYGTSLFEVTTKDLLSTSAPSKYFETTYPVIDGTLFSDNGKYWLFYKKEVENQNRIYYASLFDLNGNVDSVFDQNRIEQFYYYTEGPFVVKGKEANYLYINAYPIKDYYVAKFTDLDGSNDFTWLTRDQYVMPSDNVQHGSVIEITQKELDSLLNTYKE